MSVLSSLMHRGDAPTGAIEVATATNQRWSLSWDRGHAEIFSVGASLHNLEFLLSDGTTVRPLAEAPWQGNPAVASNAKIPAHLRQLGGEWPCVPFGTTQVDPHHHGYGADHSWHVTQQAAGSISLAVDYPRDHPIAYLERRVTGVAGVAAVDIYLAVEARRACKLPVGLHPIFRLPAKGRVHLVDANLMCGRTFPQTFEPGVSRLQPAAEFVDLTSVPLADGEVVDLAVLPSGLREEIVQLEGVAGSICLAYPTENHYVRLDWNRQDFPSLILWVSDCGRAASPWSRRFRGIGIEPVCAYFDNTSLAGSPPAGIFGAHEFAAGERWCTNYRISAENYQGLTE